ncbi:MAG: AI-2E family transporter [Firmicutes bacterium HGW-Firmicutes-20]|nr:MAG: AI-2E family transporter [Firmicutes bacterium HGW-Firmicutes-20]PKM88225.1 MAG: AI-2E family transporter [Firmicutes bacterium HGW-Firmicutes-10]
MRLNDENMKKMMLLIFFGAVMLFVSLNFLDLLVYLLKLLSILTPFMVGFAIAFIFNGPMMWIERFLFEKPGWLKKIPLKIHRSISYILTLTGFTVLFTMILTYIIPQLYETIRVIVVEVQKPEHWNTLIAWIEGIIGENAMIEDWIFGLNINWVDIEKSIVAFFEQSWLEWLQNTFTFASSLLSGLTTIIIGFFFSVYALLQKEYVIRGLHKVVDAFFSKKSADKIYHVGTISNRIFSHFVYGQGVEAIILGAIFFVVLSLLNYPYVLLISVLIGVTALVPMVGAFIGMFFGFLLILIADPIKALWFILIFNVIGQIENNFIYPQVAGKASGLPSIWILLAITVGGTLFGVLGILLFIPLASVVYALFKEYVNYRLESKNL